MAAREGRWGVTVPGLLWNGVAKDIYLFIISLEAAVLQALTFLVSPHLH